MKKKIIPGVSRSFSSFFDFPGGFSRSEINFQEVPGVSRSFQECWPPCYLLQNLGFLINKKKSQLQPTSTIQFLGVQIDSVKIELKPSPGKGRQNSTSMLLIEGEKMGNIERINIIDRSVNQLSYSSPHSTSAIPCNAETTDFRTGIRKGFSVSSGFESRSQSGTRLVDSEFIFEQREDSSPEFQSTVNVFRRLKGGLGCLLPGSESRRSLGHHGKRVSHKLSRTESSQVSYSNIFKNFPFHKSNSSSDGQYDSISLFEENGRYQELRIVQSQQGDMGNFDVSKDHNYCITFGRKIEHRSGLRVSVGQGLKRVETMSNSFQENYSSSLDAMHRSVCIPTFSSSLKISFMETRSIQPRERCVLDVLGKSQGVCISPILSYPKGYDESFERQGNSYTNNSSLANTSLVSTGLSVVNQGPHTCSKVQGCVKISSSGDTSTSRKSISSASGLDSFREQLTSEGISGDAAELISASRRKSTRSRYESAWRKWSSWCSQQEIDSICCPVNHILNFLSSKFKEGLQHGAIAGYMFAISAYHLPIDGFKVGEHPRVSELMKGIFNKRPPQPKYNFIWDVDIVVNFIDGMGDNKSIQSLLLAKKLAMLLALTSSSRAHEICYLDITGLPLFLKSKFQLFVFKIY